MCGFVGYYSENVKDENIIKSMSDVIAHRGPDSEGYYINGAVHFGFRRLSIIDVSEGAQPIYNEKGDIVIIFNGEIYNYQEIREDLIKKGYKFKTKTDTEVILLGYEEYGEEGILQKLRGMFAFTIWDDRKKRLFGARDHFGIKPYYYYNEDGNFLFGSEIKAFLKFPKFKKEINEKALKHYLMFQYNPLEETFFKGVKKLRSGHYFTFENNHLEIKKYFTLKYEYKDIGLESTINSIEKEVESSIEYHKISDVEVGAFLSGGVDSSYVVSKAKVDKTFSVGFKNKGFNETNFSKDLSDILGLKNFSKIIDERELFNGIKKVQYYSDEPHANLSAVPLYYLAGMAREHVKVVLSGEGADELFGGYNEHAMPILNVIYSKLPFFLRNKIYKLTKNKKHFHGKTIITRFGEKVEDSYIGLAKIMSDNEANSILKPKFKSKVKAKDLTKIYYDQVKNADPTTKKMYLDMNMWIVEDILLKADKMTMANSLELRVPLLDKEMWNLARKIPVKYKINSKNTKYAFRKAAERAIPTEWSDRRKVGFMVPFSDIVRNKEYYDLVKAMFNKEFVSQFFDTEKINDLLDKHYNNIENFGRKIYTIYTFLVWYEIYFCNNGVLNE